MTDPIDILAIAALREHEAQRWWHATQHLPPSRATTVETQEAMVELLLARRDTDRARALIMELDA